MNYTTLKSSIADFLNRQDLTSVIPTFIELAEADLNRSLRHRSMLCRSTATMETQYTALPSDFLEAKNIQLNQNPVVSLKYLSLEHLDRMKSKYTTTGVPVYYTIIGDNIEALPSPASSYTIELVYYKKLVSLSEANTSNWLLSSHPDVYLYGALMQSAPYLKNDERIPVWGSMYRQFVADVNSSSDRAEYSGSSLVMQANL